MNSIGASSKIKHLQLRFATIYIRLAASFLSYQTLYSMTSVPKILLKQPVDLANQANQRIGLFPKRGAQAGERKTRKYQVYFFARFKRRAGTPI
jgi:hypothetical protein